MNISIDSNGNVSIDKTFNTSNADIINAKLTTILNQMKLFDSVQMEILVQKLNDLYPRLENFEIFLAEWEQVLERVEL